MADYRLSERAAQDLEDIYVHTFRQFGDAQAETYIQALTDRFALLAARPQIGRRIDHIRTGYRRFEVGSHIVFYAPDETGILIVRILHQSMDVERHMD
jgi:toxin ParE1/3/4